MRFGSNDRSKNLMKVMKKVTIKMREIFWKGDVSKMAELKT